jgi:hypothetical protein
MLSATCFLGDAFDHRAEVLEAVRVVGIGVDCAG